MAGYTAANNVLGFLYSAVNAVTQACMSFTSQNYSVGKTKRMDRVFVDCIILSVGVSAVLGVGAYVFGSQVLGIYTSDPEVIQCGLEILSITTVPLFPMRYYGSYTGSSQGNGTFRRAYDPLYYRNGRYQGFVDLCIFPSTQIPALFIYFLSRVWIATIVMQAVCFYFVRKQCMRQVKQEIHPAGSKSRYGFMFMKISGDFKNFYSF